MIKYFFVAAMILACNLSINCMASQSRDVNNKIMHVYFIEFGTKTYAPITADSIISESDYAISFYGRHNFIENIINTLESTPDKSSRIDSKNIRLKVEIAFEDIKNTYLVDCSGNVLKVDNGKSFRLSDDVLEKLQKEIIYFHGVVDSRPEKTPWGDK